MNLFLRLVYLVFLNNVYKKKTTKNTTYNIFRASKNRAYAFMPKKRTVCCVLALKMM